MPPRRPQERSQLTRQALLSAARALFAEQGFTKTGREQIAERAGVTRGALYHHFANKEGLFRAVVEDVESEVVERAAAAALRGADAAERLRRGCDAFLDACLDPAVQRIMLVDGPAVLGWETWREIEARHALALLLHGLQGARDEGRLGTVAVEPLAHLLLGALSEAAVVVANAAQPRSARREVGRTVRYLLDRLLDGDAAP